jgi:hypothetical protein
VVLRLLILKHVRNWSYDVLEREVRAKLVYRDFTRVGADKMPDAKTMGRWGVALGPAVIKQIHDRIVQIAQAQGVVQGRRMRLDTTVVEANIHYPTDSSLLGRWRAGADPYHEEDHPARRHDRHQAARSLAQREAQAARDRPCGARQGRAEPGEAAASLWPIAGRDRPGGRAGQALLL